MLVISLITTVFIVIATLLPMSKNPHWIVRGMDFPRLQIAILAAGLIVFDFIFLDLTLSITWLVIIAALFCLIWQVMWVLPYTFLWRKEVLSSTVDDPLRQLSIITANVLQTNHNSAALINRVNEYKPDVLVTLESDSWWEKNLEVVENEMPYSVKCPLDNLYGMHVYSRLPIIKEKISFLVEDGVPSMHLCIELRTGDVVNVHFVHPAPPSPTENEESSERDAELIIIAKSVGETDEPVIVTGDLNDVAWSRTTRLFRKISGLLDPRVGRGMFNTFHAGIPFLRWPLDHLFHSPHFTIKNIKRLSSIGSDHFSLFTVLIFNPTKAKQQEDITADEQDFHVADEIVAEQPVNTNDVPTLNE
ncbi:MAG: endonuclease [Oleispira sp.]|nr:endonuclease [Oleispira sp.]